METWVYDVESYCNLFMVSFIPLNTDQVLINTYIAADKAGDKKSKQILLRAMNVKTFTIFKGIKNDTYTKDDRWLLHDFLRVHKILYGYNSNQYDSIMLDLLQYFSKVFSNKTAMDKNLKHISEFLNEHSQNIINYGKGYRYTLDFYKNYKRTFTDRDIQKILYLDKSMTGLKKVAINLKWYRLQELPISPYKAINSSQIEEIVDYNINDILITHKLITEQKDELTIREVGSDEFQLNLNNMSRSSIGKALVTKYYSQLTGLDVKDFFDKRTIRYAIRVADILDNNIEFKTKQFNKLYKAIANSIIRISSDKEKSDWGYSLLYNGTKYIVAKGGLHSKDNPMIYDITKLPNMIMRDADVTSFYPKTILNLKIGPAHLDIPVFLAIVDYVMTSRVKAKHQIKSLAATDPEASELIKKKAEIYKIAINRMYGAFKDTFDYLYDPNCTYKTTINGQLYLLNLAEQFEINGINVISANTDGIVCLFDKSLEEKYKQICNDWQKKFDYELEFTDYEKYIRNDVNNYIAIKKGFTEKYSIGLAAGEDIENLRKQLEKSHVKFKGLFIDKPDYSKGFINPVVSTALNKFYVYGDSIESTFENHLKKKDGIYDFCITQKIDKKFNAQYHTIVDGKREIIPLQQYNRFYVSSSNVGNILKYDSDKKKYISLVAKENVRVLNFYDGHAITDLKMKYYINECYKIIYGNKKKFGISDNKLSFDFAPEETVLDWENDPDIKEISLEEEKDEKFISEYESLYDTSDEDIPF